MDQTEEALKAVRRGTGWLIAQVIGTIVAIPFATLGLSIWCLFIMDTSHGYPAAGIEGQLRVFGFFLWAIPLWIAVAVILGVFGLRESLAAKGALVAGVGLTLIGFVTALVGAH